MSGVQSALDAAGPQAARIESLWWLMFYLLTAIYVIVMIVVLVSALRRRTETTDVAKQEQRASRTVTGAVAATIVILFGLLLSSFLVGRALNSALPATGNELTIEITGHQWWWAVRYNHPAPNQVVMTANEIRIPVGRPVRFKLNSTDVIHSFWVPNLHGKTDLIPSHPAETWLQADHPGVYRGQCAEFCGLQHAHMSFEVIAEPEQQFQAWYAAQVQSAVQPATPQQVRGQQVFLNSTCVMCHRIQGTDAGGNVGPDLTHVAGRQTIAAGTLANTRENLRRWIVDPQQIKPGNHMPPNPLQPDDLEALLDYLLILK